MLAFPANDYRGNWWWMESTPKLSAYECSFSDEFSDINHVTSSMERGSEDALITIIRKSGVVEKRAAYPEGSARLKQLMENRNALQARGISVVDARLEGKSYVMPCGYHSRY